MVKFSKELEAQLIPEWKDAFVNYSHLKKKVKKVKVRRGSHSAEEQPDFGVSLLDTFCFISRKISSAFRDRKAEKREIIKVRVQGGEDEEALYETDLVEVASDQEDEIKKFFERLNGELEKVNQFYQTKEREFLERADILKKQLQTLVDLKQVLDDQRKKSYPLKTTRLRTLPSFNFSSVERSGHHAAMESQAVPEEPAGPNSSTGGGKTAAAPLTKGRTRIDIPATTPGRTISAVTSTLWNDVLGSPKKENWKGEHVNRKRLQCAEKMIRGAFVELYRGLGLLQKYSSLNMVAFTKILKKFDKVAIQQASGTYLQVVRRSHFISSDKVVRLADEVESVFTQHFANSDRKRAMKFLRPQQGKESHMISFLVGLFTGCFVTLFSLYAILAHMAGMFVSTADNYIDTVYPTFSMFTLFSLHIFMYGCNLYAWRNTRINYNFIFEFNHSTAMRNRDAFLMCTSFMTMVVAAMVVHLLLTSSGFSPTYVDTIPGILILLFLALLIWPFNIFYRSTRYCFLKVIRNIVASPFYKVVMVDFFMADQLTSQIPLLRHMEFTACYFLAGSFKTHEHQSCTSSKLYKELAYVISFIPYYCRAMQCARRWFDEGDINHIANLGKYVSAMMAAGARLTYAMNPTSFWFSMVLATSSIATIYQLYWDFVKDWGLLNRKSINPWLRDDLVLKQKGIYYFSIALNLFLRLAWVEAVMHINLAEMDSKLLDFFLASLEIIRRGHWNFYRLENEHLNNVGKFRAVKAVPLPFRDLDADD